MIESSISWTIGLALTYLFYCIGTPFVLLVILLDGFIGTFSKYHVGLCLSGLILCLCGWFDFVLVKFCLLSFLLTKNFGQLSKKYTSGKKCLHAMLKLTRLTGIKSDELDMMEYVDSTTTYIDKKIEHVDNSYNTVKSMAIAKTNKVVETELYKDITYAVSISDYVIGNVFDFVKVNTMLAGEFVYAIPYLRGYLDKGNKYLTVGNDLYSKYDKEDPFDSPNLANDMKVEAPLNMNIDMDKLGDLAGLMTNFLDSIGGMNIGTQENHKQFDKQIHMPYQYTDYSKLPPSTDTFVDDILDPTKWGLSSSMILHNNMRIDDIDDITPLDEEIETKLDDEPEIMSDDEIHEMLNRGGKISEKQLSHAFNTVSEITSKKNNSTINNAKITLKKKKN